MSLGSLSSIVDLGANPPRLVANYYPDPVITNCQAGLYSGGVLVGSKIPFSLRDGVANLPIFSVPAAGTYTTRVYSGDGATLLLESAPFTASAGGTIPPETGTLSGVPSSGTAGTALATGGTFTLANAPGSGTTAYVGLWNVSMGAYQGVLQGLTGASGSLPALTPAAAGTYAVKLASDSVGATVLATSGSITVAAASGGTVATAASVPVVPSVAGVGVPIAGVTCNLTPSGATAYASLTIGATEQMPRVSFTGTSVPSLTPASAGSATVKIWAAATGGSALATSTAFAAVVSASSYSTILSASAGGVNAPVTVSFGGNSVWPANTSIAISLSGAAASLGSAVLSPVAGSFDAVTTTVTPSALGSVVISTTCSSANGALTNASGNQTYSVVELANAPTGVTLSNATEVGMRVAWTPPSSGPAPSLYLIDISTDGGATFVQQGGVGGNPMPTSSLLSNLNPGTSYIARVTGATGDTTYGSGARGATSSNSNALSTSPTTSAPTAPTALAGSPWPYSPTTMIHVSWTGAIPPYVASATLTQRTPSGSGSFIPSTYTYSPGSQSINARGLTAGTSYDFQLVLTNSIGSTAPVTLTNVSTASA